MALSLQVRSTAVILSGLLGAAGARADDVKILTTGIVKGAFAPIAPNSNARPATR